MKIIIGGECVLLLSLLAAVIDGQSAAAAASCETLASLRLPNTTTTLAQSVPAGIFTLPTIDPAATAQSIPDLPAFCRFAATLTPSSDSDITIEVWMPAANWNGKFQAVGNGGFAGSISYGAMAEALRRGYATSSTDTGHKGGSGSFALGHPEKYIDFEYRSVHEMTVKAKAVVNAFYGKNPRFSYWNGCSAGGRQGLVEAQRFPRDYDGVIAGAGGYHRNRLAAWAVWVAHAMHKDPASYIPPAKYAAIHQTVVGSCDAIDGLKDGLIDDPTRCHFDPKVLACADDDGPTCLTAPQVAAARKILSPAINPRTGVQIFPGLEPGAELGWNGRAGAEPSAIAVEHFKYMVFQNPNWDWRTLNFDSDITLIDKIENSTTNALNPDLRPFMQRGGKLLMYHGWSDPLVPPTTSLNYYKHVLASMGGSAQTSKWLRIFMIPGMAHCGGGEGPNTFDMVTALEQWVENGKAPEQILASHSTGEKVDRTRPLCPYPQVARYTGTGSTDDAANLVCAASAAAKGSTR